MTVCLWSRSPLTLFCLSSESIMLLFLRHQLPPTATCRAKPLLGILCKTLSSKSHWKEKRNRPNINELFNSNRFFFTYLSLEQWLMACSVSWEGPRLLLPKLISHHYRDILRCTSHPFALSLRVIRLAAHLMRPECCVYSQFAPLLLRSMFHMCDYGRRHADSSPVPRGAAGRMCAWTRCLVARN